MRRLRKWSEWTEPSPPDLDTIDWLAHFGPVEARRASLFVRTNDRETGDGAGRGVGRPATGATDPGGDPDPTRTVAGRSRPGRPGTVPALRRRGSPLERRRPRPPPVSSPRGDHPARRSTATLVTSAVARRCRSETGESWWWPATAVRGKSTLTGPWCSGGTATSPTRSPPSARLVASAALANTGPPRRSTCRRTAPAWFLRLGPVPGRRLGVHRAAGAAPDRHRAPASSSPWSASPLVLAAMALWTDDKAVLIVGVVVAGGFLGVNNTLITETVMTVSPVERGVASVGLQLRAVRRRRGGAVHGRQAR